MEIVPLIIILFIFGSGYVLGWNTGNWHAINFIKKHIKEEVK